MQVELTDDQADLLERLLRANRQTLDDILDAIAEADARDEDIRWRLIGEKEGVA